MIKYIKKGFIFILSLQLTGCMTFPFDRPEKINPESAETKFLGKMDINIKDDQFVPYSKELKSDFLYPRSLDVKEKIGTANFDLQDCEMTRGFWKNPYTILSVLTLTAFPIGNVYECKTILEVKLSGSKEKVRTETVTKYYHGTGLSAILWGPLNFTFFYFTKVDSAREATRIYLEQGDKAP
jgi:hypothetical protein